jgi:hypothetical protein
LLDDVQLDRRRSARRITMVQSRLSSDSDDLLQSLDTRDEEVLAAPHNNELIWHTQIVRLGLGVETGHRARTRARGLANEGVEARGDGLPRREAGGICPCWKEKLVSSSQRNGRRVNAHIAGRTRTRSPKSSGSKRKPTLSH